MTNGFFNSLGLSTQAQAKSTSSGPKEGEANALRNESVSQGAERYAAKSRRGRAGEEGTDEGESRGGHRPRVKRRRAPPPTCYKGWEFWCADNKPATPWRRGKVVKCRDRKVAAPPALDLRRDCA